MAPPPAMAAAAAADWVVAAVTAASTVAGSGREAGSKTWSRLLLVLWLRRAGLAVGTTKALARCGVVRQHATSASATSSGWNNSALAMMMMIG